VARLLGQWLSERLGQQFVIENRPGAGGSIGTEAVVRAPADGYAILMIGPSAAINVTLYEGLSFRCATSSRSPASCARPMCGAASGVAGAHESPNSSPMPEANPGKINMASAGNGSSQHVAANCSS
jgi:tripartite-type tricarboxylate transporter receptor subunit TctC